jgi:preprotein translocase subunit SecY
MPIIFAQAIMFLPTGLAGSDFLGDGFKGVMNEIGDPNSVWYNITTAILIVVMTYFYTAMVVNPRQMAEDFKKQGAFIPGIKPGNDTASYIDGIMSKIMFPGALFLALIAIFPVFDRMANVNSGFYYFFGGTSLLIMVSVVLDTLQQVDGYLLMSHYDGLMKTGKVRGESSLSESSSVGMI